MSYRNQFNALIDQILESLNRNLSIFIVRDRLHHGAGAPGGSMRVLLSANGLALLALNQNINLFYPPDQVVGGGAPVDGRYRSRPRPR